MAALPGVLGEALQVFVVSVGIQPLGSLTGEDAIEEPRGRWGERGSGRHDLLRIARAPVARAATGRGLQVEESIHLRPS